MLICWFKIPGRKNTSERVKVTGRFHLRVFIYWTAEVESQVHVVLVRNSFNGFQHSSSSVDTLITYFPGSFKVHAVIVLVKMYHKCHFYHIFLYLDLSRLVRT